MILRSGYEEVFCHKNDSNDRCYRGLKSGRVAYTHRLKVGMPVTFANDVILPPSGGAKDRSPYLIPAGTQVTLLSVGCAYTPSAVQVDSESIDRINIHADYFEWSEQLNSIAQA
jgi:hypothetical protein